MIEQHYHIFDSDEKVDSIEIFLNTNSNISIINARGMEIEMSMEVATDVMNILRSMIPRIDD